MIDLHPGPVFSRKVRCWNSAHGCNFAGPVSALLEHFENDCVHHRASCPRCHQDVPQLHLVQHCADNCSPASGERGVEPTPPVLNDLEKACAEFRQTFAQLWDQNYEPQTSLNSVSRDLKHGLPTETIQALLCAISAFEDTGTMHCVTGFAPGLDWRPLDFVEPLPSDRVCELCGVLARRATALPCSHLLCETCYEGVVACGRCPLDGDTHNVDSVKMIDLHPGPVLKLKVRCWNSAHGCNFTGPVSAILEHFENDCVHHRALCPRCHQDVPRLHLVQHCADNCSPASGERGVEPTRPVLSDLEKACAEFRQSFAELRNQNYELQTSLNSVARDLKHGLPSETIQTLLCAISGILRDDRVAPIVEMTLSSCTGSRGGSSSKCSGEGSRADSLDDMTTFCVDVFTGHPGSNQRLLEVSALCPAQTRKHYGLVF
ncbi:hypothetical protein HPB47_015851 [Ixodes persulcatus]|uniref:Uncharacterized protein n=1 Tax=Ixodes persulcatus TaxID=34615 RepID=A0AC60QSC0_IXOPE|nr:hypothetical protein HPB47_015851 [Ixodes persulcatus]